MEVKAVAKNTGLPAAKVRPLVDMVRGKTVDEALTLLQFTPTPKAKVVAKMLEIAGRTDIPIGIGPTRGGLSRGHRQDAWIQGYDMSSYRGTVYEDGVQAMVDTIMKSSRPIKVVAVGPLPNVAAALEREPRIAELAEFVGMHGSIRLGYGGIVILINACGIHRDVDVTAGGTLQLPADSHCAAAGYVPQFLGRRLTRQCGIGIYDYGGGDNGEQQQRRSGGEPAARAGGSVSGSVHENLSLALDTGIRCSK